MKTQQILDKLNIHSLNAMQEATADALLHSDKDVVVLSPTGSGKTLAYLLPLVERIDASSDNVQVVVLVPGRELALQSATVLGDMGSGLRAMSLYGGRPAMDEHRQMRVVKPQIVFSTPGRLNDHLDKGNILADAIQTLVIDEFDKCLEMGFRDEMEAIVRKLPALRRRILLSATEAVETLQAVGADAVGLNCSVGPDQLESVVASMKAVAQVPVIAKPNAGLPVIDEQGRAHYSMDPDTFARAMTRLIQAGATLVGGCCGTDPEYIRRLREKREQGAGNREQE